MPLGAVRILCSDSSTNALGRVLLLADLLANEADVTILGFRDQAPIWAPARGFHVTIEDRRLKQSWQYPAAARWLRGRLGGARIIVHKPLATSLGLALLAGAKPRSILLDIDDWELGLRQSTRMAGLTGAHRALRTVRDLLGPRQLNSYASTWALDRGAGRFPHRTASNSFLQERFGGHLLPHVRDTTKLDPAQVSALDLRSKLRMDGRIWVGFIGTPRAHKGLDELVDALASLAGRDAPGLLLAGADPRDSFSAGIIERARASLGQDRLRTVPSFDFSELPRWAAAPDIICLPSRDTAAAHGQIPAKLFDAMAMAKPIVATRVSDIALILQGCGLVIEPGDVGALAAALDELARDPSKREALGRAARARAIHSYSYEAGRRTLRSALDAVEPHQ
jgi:glycosyltransferase involved in cell wall biosynthesis